MAPAVWPHRPCHLRSELDTAGNCCHGNKDITPDTSPFPEAWDKAAPVHLSLIHISEPTRPRLI
eukprot:5457940-Amphidinium_carterae.1